MTGGTVLVTGAGGQVGRELVGLLGPRAVGLSHADLDVTDRDAVHSAVGAARPDAVIHAAAWTAVDACEAEPEKAFAINEAGTRHVAEAAHDVGARLCYVSTDYVFDGTKAEPYVETDVPHPASVYGRSKLAGELAAGPEAVVARTSWVCGRHGGNMVKTILRVAAQQDELRFVDDQRGHPTFADGLAAKLVELVDGGHRGTFHVTHQGAVSWYEFARAVLTAAGMDPDRVRPVATVDLDPPRPAPRPANSVLENAALREAGLELLGPFEVPLERLVQLLRTGAGDDREH
jgi:dTDP-4-dehydrorhamnose reductase